MHQPSALYKRHRFPGEIISHAVWLYYRFLRFKSPAHAQQVLAPFGPISDHFRPRRHRLPAPAYHTLQQTRFTTWREATGLAAA